MTNPHVTVLVVDDEVRSIEAIQRVLSDEFEVIGARNAKESEEVLQGEMVQVILCDQRMPGEFGVEFLKRVRELFSRTRSAMSSPTTPIAATLSGRFNNTGIRHCITKPWSPDKLIDCVRESARLWRMQREITDMLIEVKPASPRSKRSSADRRRNQTQSFGFGRIVFQSDSPRSTRSRSPDAQHATTHRFWSPAHRRPAGNFSPERSTGVGACG